MLCNVGTPISQWMMDNLMTDAEETWDNKNDILQKDVGNNMNWTCEQQRSFREKEHARSI